MINLISHKYKYILKVFPKSGSSTLKNLFLHLHWEELGFKKAPNLSNQYFHRVEHNLKDGKVNDDIFKKYKSYHKIYVVRNTYERVVSMYFNRYLDILREFII